MFNLLPKKDKEFALGEYVRRRILAILGLTLLTVIVALLALVPSHLISWYKFREVTHTQGLLRGNLAVKSKENLNAVITKTNMKIKSLAPEPGVGAAEVIRDAAEKKSEGVRITGFNFRYDDKKKLIGVIEGKAVNREVLLAFVRALKENKAYSKVDLPISNFAQENDIEFTVSVTGA